MGYFRAGFSVVGVDLEAQTRFPFEFVQMDALDWDDFSGFDAIHASPPCQAYSQVTRCAGDHAHRTEDLIVPTRELLIRSGLPYVIENVPGAPLRTPQKICGAELGLRVRRHRLFETNWPLKVGPCMHDPAGKIRLLLQFEEFMRTGDFMVDEYQENPVDVTGSSGGKGGVDLWKEAMGIDWMVARELTQAIPPAYTELIGSQLISYLKDSRPGVGFEPTFSDV